MCSDELLLALRDANLQVGDINGGNLGTFRLMNVSPGLDSGTAYVNFGKYSENYAYTGGSDYIQLTADGGKKFIYISPLNPVGEPGTRLKIYASISASESYCKRYGPKPLFGTAPCLETGWRTVTLSKDEYIGSFAQTAVRPLMTSDVGSINVIEGSSTNIVFTVNEIVNGRFEYLSPGGVWWTAVESSQPDQGIPNWHIGSSGMTNSFVLQILESRRIFDGSGFRFIGHGAGGSVTSRIATLTVPRLQQDPPTFTTQPSDISVITGQPARFTCAVSGNQPMTYFWRVNNEAPTVSTLPEFTLVRATMNDNGAQITCVASNSFGTATSRAARLTVVPVDTGGRKIFIAGVGGNPGGIAIVPVLMTSLGNENAVGTSVSWDPLQLTLNSVSLEGVPNGIQVIVNNSASLLATGRMGLLASASAGQSFPAGTNLLARLNFTIAATVVSPSSVELRMGDVPVASEVSSIAADALPADFVGATVEVTTGIEGDLSPRPLGNGILSSTDFTLAGRIIAGLELVLSESEYMRVDTAPRDTSGNGQLTSADLTQVGRYVAGLNAPEAAGGPRSQSNRRIVATANSFETAAGSNSLSRVLRLVGGAIPSAGTVVIPVQLDALGNENSIGGSVIFPPQALRFIRATAPSGVSLVVNTLRTNEGRIGLLLSLPAGSGFPEGETNVTLLNFEVLSVASPISMSWGDSPVFREVASVEADALLTEFSGTSLTSIVSPPSVLQPRLFFGLSIEGTIGMSYRIESAGSHEGPWNAMALVTLTNSPQVWIDTSQTVGTTRVYRAINP
jgi:hypothetical protein